MAQMVTIATNRTVDRAGLDEFVSTRHRGVLLTTRRDGWPQASLVTMGLGSDGRILVSSYPQRAKVHNLRRNPKVSIVVMSEQFNGEWVQIDGDVEVIDSPAAVEGLVDYFRVISGEHSNWDEYRAAMIKQAKCLIAIRIARWGPVAKGGFPPSVAAEMS